MDPISNPAPFFASLEFEPYEGTREWERLKSQKGKRSQ